MDKKITREVFRFSAHDELNKPYSLILFQTFIVTTTTSGTEEVPGMKTLQTDRGEHVNIDAANRKLTMPSQLPGFGSTLTPVDPSVWDVLAPPDRQAKS